MKKLIVAGIILILSVFSVIICFATSDINEETTQSALVLQDIDSDVITELPVKEITANTIYKDCLESASDMKLYEFTISSRCGLSIEFTHKTDDTDTATGWGLYLFEKYSKTGDGKNYGYRLVNKYSADISELTTTTSFSGVYPGEFVFVVTAGSTFTATEYMFKLTADYTNLYEAEPNNEKAYYTEILTDSTYKGISNSTQQVDNDWYLFTLKENGGIDIEFEYGRGSLSQVLWFVTLENEAGECFYRSRIYGNDTSASSGEIGLPSGNYLICVETYTQNDIQYSLTVKTADVSEVEFNDTLETAEELEFTESVAVKSGSISERRGSYDIDYYTFETENDGVFVLSFGHHTYARTDTGWEITVTDEDGHIIFYDVSYWNEGSKVAPLMGVNAGKYYIKIDADGMRYCNATYTLKLGVVETDLWETENNDTTDTADKISLDTPISGTLVNNKLDYDTDYYCIDITEKTYAYLNFSHSNLGTQDEGWIITITNEDGKELDSFTSKWVDTKRLSKLLTLNPGRYYISVDTGLHFNNKKYTLKLESIE